MRLFTRTLLQGLHDGLVEHGGMPPFPNDKIAFEIFDEISATHGLPPYLEHRLDKTAAVTLSRAIVDYSEKLAGAGMAAPPQRVALVKQAAQRDLGERALIVAQHYMQKAAEEGSLLPSGPNSLAASAQHDQIAAVDLRNRPEGRYGVPIGTTDMPVPGMIGREMAAPGAPSVGASFKGASPLDSLRNHADAASDWARRQGNDIYYGAKNLPAQMGEAAEAAGQFGREMLQPRAQWAGLKDNLGQVRDATSWLKNDPSTLENLGHTHASMAALRKEKAMAALGHFGRLGALGGVAAGGMVGAGLLGRAAYNHFTEGREGTAAVKVAEGLPGAAAAGRDPLIASIIDTALRRTAEPAAHPIPYNPLGPETSAATQSLGQSLRSAVSRHGVLDELTSSPLAHVRQFGNRDLGGKLRSVGAVGAQIGVPLAAAAGAKALYDHYNKETTASDEDIAAIVGVLQEHNIEVTPEIVAAMHAKMNEGEAAPGDNAASPPPADSEKEAQQRGWDAILKAAGEGSLVPTTPNTLASAAKHDQIAAVDKKNRPEGAYKVPVGKTQLSTAAGTVGAEKKAAEAAYWQNLEATAAEWGQYLPAAMPLEVKREAIVKIASLAPNARETFVRSLHT